MSLDISIYRFLNGFNITHNMGEMARNIPVGDKWTWTLYDVMWHGDENNLINTNDITVFLQNAVRYMKKNKEELQKFNPENGWGDYDGLLKTVEDFLESCVEFPNCRIDFDR